MSLGYETLVFYQRSYPSSWTVALCGGVAGLVAGGVVGGLLKPPAARNRQPGAGGKVED